MKKHLFVILLLFSVFPLFSQTVEWLIKPKYDDIQPVHNNLLKVKIEEKVGIINQNGKDVVPVSYDSISQFADGKALILNKLGNVIVGIVYAKQETFILLEKTYRIDTDFPYYSDGYLVVQNENGKWGFLTEEGKEGEGFLSCTNESVLPFSENISFINIDAKNHAYINSQGQPLIGRFGKVVEGFSFCNGEALVFNSSFNWAWIDINGNVKKETKAPKQKFLPNKSGKTITHSGNTFVFDCQWRLKEYMLENGEKVSLDNPKNIQPLEPVICQNLSLNNKSSGVELIFNNKQIIPTQFESGEIINQQLVIISHNNKKCILQIVPNQTIEMIFPTKEIVFQHFQHSTLQMTLNKPIFLKSEQINMLVTDDQGKIITFKETVNQPDRILYESDFIKSATEFNTSAIYSYDVQVDANDIIYYNSSFSTSVVYKPGFEVVCNTPTVEADSNAMARVVLSIKNISNVSSEITEIKVKCNDITLYDNPHFIAANQSIKIPLTITARSSEDYIIRNLFVSLFEKQCPIINKKVTINIKRYVPTE